MNRKLFFLLFTLTVTLSCTRQNETFTIDKNRLGKVRGLMSPEQVKNLYPNDSIEIIKPEEGDWLKQTKLIIHKKGEEGPLMILFYEKQGDSMVLTAGEPADPAFTTVRGVKITDPYQKWTEKHKPSHVERTLRHVVVFLKDLNATLEFTEDDLPQTLQHNLSVQPDIHSIKKSAVPKRIIVFFE